MGTDIVKRRVLSLSCALCLLLSLVGCNSSYRLAKDYATRDTFGYLVFVSKSGQSYDDLWVNISGLDKTFLAQTGSIAGDTIKGMRYGAQQGERSVMVRKQNERMLYRGIVKILAGEVTVITLED